MKVGVVVPNVEMTERQLKERRNFLLGNAREGTDVVMIKLEEGPVSIESSLEHEQSGYFMAMKIGELQKDGYDAFITWCGEDAGLISAREVSRIPVIGPFQSSCAIAITLGHKFSVVAPMVQRAFMERKVWEMGLGSRLASVRSLGIPVLDVRKNLKKSALLLEKVCRSATEEDGADVIIPSCMALYGMAAPLMERLDLPVIDPGLAALKMAETVVALGLAHSKISYPFPAKFGQGRERPGRK